MGSEHTGGKRSVTRRLQESTNEVMRCWARRRAFSISGSRLVPSHVALFSPPSCILFCHHHCHVAPLFFKFSLL